MSVPSNVEGRRLGMVQLVGKPRRLENRRTLYEARRDLVCAKCGGKIAKGTPFLRGNGMANVCPECQPYELPVPRVREGRHAA